MKELKVYVPQDGPYGLEPEEGGEPVEEETCYLKSDVDAVIAELKQKLEDAGMRERRLKRALWLARAERAEWESLYYWYAVSDKYKSRKFDEVERKCLKKAKEYL